MSDYITLAALKATLNITNTTLDQDVAAAITAASRAIDQLANRRFYPDADATQVRYYSPTGKTILEIDDLVTLTSFKTDEDGAYTYPNVWTVNTDLFLDPLNAAADAVPFTSIQVGPLGNFVLPTWLPRSVKVTGKFGWASVPGPIVQATTLLASRLQKQAREAPLGVMSFGEQAIHISRMDSTVMALIGPYRRHRVAVG